MGFPEDCIQSLVGDDKWWIKSEESNIKRGSLIRAFLPYVDQQPYCFRPLGRSEPTEHGEADIIVEPLKVNQSVQKMQLPVAAMTLHHKEVWAAYRAKKRPCLVLGIKGDTVDKSLTKGKPKHATAPTLIVAPSFGVDENTGNRSGYSKEFVDRVKRLLYPQFHWDMLPLHGVDQSIIRLDQIQPIGSSYSAYESSGYSLSESGLNVIDDLLRKHLWGLDYQSEEVSMFDQLKEDFIP